MATLYFKSGLNRIAVAICISRILAIQITSRRVVVSTRTASRKPPTRKAAVNCRPTPRHNTPHLISAKNILDVLKAHFFCFHFFEFNCFERNYQPVLIRQLADGVQALKNPLFWPNNIFMPVAGQPLLFSPVSFSRPTRAASLINLQRYNARVIGIR